MVGLKIGKWTVLEQVWIEQKRKSVFKHFKCKCECGEIKIVRADGLRNGRSSQCRKCRDNEKYININEFIGKKIGDWEIIKEIENKGKNKILLCRCKCGKEKKIRASVLKLGKTKKCHLCNITKHGYEGSKTYNTWRCMRYRCNNKKHQNYNLYGGRGIKVCDRWNKFENFLEDMGERPEGKQIDRIDTNGNYEPGNCRWVTPKENSNNRR